MKQNLECSTCKKVFTSSILRSQHIRRVHDDVLYTCATCAKSFKRKDKLQQHMMTHESVGEEYECGTCHTKFTAKRSLSQHIRMKHLGDRPDCSMCGKTFASMHNKKHHEKFNCPHLRDTPLAPYSLVSSMDVDPPESTQPVAGPSNVVESEPSTSHPQPHSSPSVNDNTEPFSQEPRSASPETDLTGTFKKTESGFKDRLQTFELRRRIPRFMTLWQFFVFVFDPLIEVIAKELEKHRSIKANIFIECEFFNMNGAKCKRNFKTKNAPLTLFSDLGQFCSDAFDKLIHEKGCCEMVGSGWTFLKVNKFEIRINKYNPLRGAAHIKLPKSILNTRSLVNVLNEDDFCFQYAMLSKFVVNEPQRPTSYTDELKSRYNWEGLTFPLPLKDISVFETNNNLSINVFGLDVKFKKSKDNKTYPVYSVFPLKICNNELSDHTDLLYIKDENTSHYMYIKDFNKLVKSQMTKHDGHLSICKRCFSHFDNQPNKLNLSGAERLVEHKKYCGTDKPLRLDLSKDKQIRFKNHERNQRSRFCIYADFECMLCPYDLVKPDPNPETKDQKSYSMNVQRHVPYSYCYRIVDTQGVFSETRLYRGDNAARHFMEAIKKDMFHIGDLLYDNRQMNPILAIDQQAEFDSAATCYLCNKQFTENDPKVRDHSHAVPYTYRGAAHRSCNLRFTEQNTVNCYFHNLSNYDAHFLIPELNIDNGQIQVLANTEEKYICFSKRMKYDGAKRNQLKLQFVDTFRFMNSSLATLVGNLPKDQLRETRKQFPQQHMFELISRKGVFPYDYVTSKETLDETSLPSPSAFYNSLTLEDVKDEDYLHAQTVWTTFGIKTLGDYSDLYLLSDVTLLSDVYENFRDMCLREYDLDPAHYLTLPSYAWDVMLKTTGVALDTLQDFDQHLFFEKAIRGGICQCCTRHAQANNKYCDGYDSTKPPQYIMYYDANNLYGYSSIFNLPSGNFQWLSADEIENLKTQLPHLTADSSTGYMLEVDLSYPNHLHDIHKSMPFCCQTQKPPNGKFSKLLTTLLDKKNYIIHYRTLQQALENGLELTKIHRVLSFDQSAWLKSYIMKNTALRKSARNAFEKDLFKLMVNAVFGRSILNPRKYIDIRLVCEDKQFEKLVARSTFIDRTFYGNDLALVHLEKTSIVLDKPIYVGACILEISKWVMYDFHYNTMMTRYRDRIDLLYTDTDSLIYNIQCDNIFNEMLNHLDDFDTSEYDPSHQCFSSANAKTLGKFKDECKGKMIKRFIGLSPKLYCVTIDNGNGKETIVKRAKGVSKGVVEHELTVEDYSRCLLEGVVKFTTNTRFESKKHEVNTIVVNKRSLSMNDDKRYILPDNIHTLPWGHRDIPPQSTD